MASEGDNSRGGGGGGGGGAKGAAPGRVREGGGGHPSRPARGYGGAL